MTTAVPMVEAWRGPFLESVHHGHAVIAHASGAVEQVWGDPDLLVLPRSSSKMIQALPLVESGAADAFGLTSEQLALACASHNGAETHVTRVSRWLEDLGLSDGDLACGPQTTRDPELHAEMIRQRAPTLRMHNNCSGKHSGFLTLAQHLGADTGGYTDIAHPVQTSVREAWERVTGETIAGFGVDGCSAPNLATSLASIATAMARFAGAAGESPMARLVRAMTAHPELVAGENRACTNLMRAMVGKVAIKTGAEGVFVAIIPEKQMGLALKISDGASRASECAVSALLVKLGVLDPRHPETAKYLNAPIRNWDGLQTGWLRAAPPLC